MGEELIVFIDGPVTFEEKGGFVQICAVIGGMRRCWMMSAQDFDRSMANGESLLAARRARRSAPPISLAAERARRA